MRERGNGCCKSTRARSSGPSGCDKGCGITSAAKSPSARPDFDQVEESHRLCSGCVCVCFERRNEENRGDGDPS